VWEDGEERGMEEALENGKELSHSAHANGMNEYTQKSYITGYFYATNHTRPTSFT
jgi:hypothetical protein